MTNERRKTGRRLKHRVKRHAAALLAVMVVLALVGLLILQSAQTLIAIRSNDVHSHRIRQARELIELGHDYVNEHGPSATAFTVQTSFGSGKVTVVPLGDASSSPRPYRLVAQFPTDNEFKATGQTETVSWSAPLSTSINTSESSDAR